MRRMVVPDGADLRGLVQRTCQALEALVASMDALDSVLLRLRRLGPPGDNPTELLAGTRETVSRVIALLRREGPPLLLRAQALRLRLRLSGYGSGRHAVSAMRMLHSDLDALAAFRLEDAPHWGFILRRIRSNATVVLTEFDGQRQSMTPELPLAPPPMAPPSPAVLAR